MAKESSMLENTPGFGSLSINDISAEFLSNYGVSFRVFKEVFFVIVSSVRVNNFKITTTLTETEVSDVFYKLPYSYEIIKSLSENLDLRLSEDSLEEIRKLISMYVTVSSTLRLKRRVADPILKMLYDRKGNLRLIGPMHAFVRRIAREDGENLDNEAKDFISDFDFLIKKNAETFGIEFKKKMGRRGNALEDYFLFEVKKILSLNSKRSTEDLTNVIKYLKANYQILFTELPVSKDAIKKCLQNYTRTIDADS